MKTPDLRSSDTAPALSRRSFLRHTTLAAAGAAAVSQFPFVVTSHAAADDPIRIGVIGCGGRGGGAALDALGAEAHVVYPQAGYHTETVKEGAAIKHKNVTIAALADAFPDRMTACRHNLSKLGVNVPGDRCFVGFDAHEKLLAVPDVNYVILAEPPHFRPQHLMAAIRAGKHVFMEKPAAVDGPGVRLVMEAGKLAKEKGLGIVAGTQRRHMRGYNETIRRIHDGALGELIYGTCYWNGGVIWVIERKPEWSDLEWQLRNWNYFTWLSGDHIVEQHVHNLDIMNWVIGAHPIKAMALGGRQARPNDNYGHIYDHFAVEYEYPNGVRMFSQCRQMDRCDNKVEEFIVGAKGSSNCANWMRVKGGENWRFRDQEVNAYEQEHLDLINSIRAGQPLNEAQAVAESTLTGIMGRESAYSGKTIEWETALNSTMRLGPEKYEFGPLPFPKVAIPGQYRFS